MTNSQSPEIAQETAPAAAASTAAPPWLTRLAARPFAVLALLGLVLWLPGILSLPALDRDESRFAQSSRQMVESGDLVDIRFGHVPRYKKPIGIYWLQAASTAVAAPFAGGDHHIWTYRLPSLLGAIVASWLTLWCALAVTGAEAAFLAGLLMLGSVLLTAEATIATTDAVLLACVLAVQGVLLRLYRAAHEADFPAPRSAVVLWGWAALGFGILIKGPVVLGVAAATILGLVAWDSWEQRRGPPAQAPVAPAWAWLQALKSWRGILLVLLLILPWLVAITIQSRGAFLEQSLGDDFAAKMAGGQESHGGWPGYYLLLSGLSFWPAILFVLPGIAQGVARRTEPAIRFILVWAASWWLAVELVPTKLPHYVIDAYPPLAILAALFVLDPRPVRFAAAARWIAITQFAIGGVLLAAAPFVLHLRFGGGSAWWLSLPGALGGLVALAALILFLRRRHYWALCLGLLALFMIVPTLTAVVGPRLDRLWLSGKLEHAVAALSRPGDPPPILAGYQEPSLVFALGKDVVLADGKGAAEVGARSGGLVLVEDSERGDFLARLAELQSDATWLEALSGYNYSRSKEVKVNFYRVAPQRDLN